MRKKIILSLGLALLFMLGGCKEEETAEAEFYADGCRLHLGLVTDQSGVDDNAFNQLVWEGLLRFGAENEIRESCFGYYAAMDESEKLPFLTQLAEEKYDLIIAADYDFVDAINAVAEIYPSLNFLLIDNTSSSENVLSVEFKAEEAAYLAGMAAALQASSMEMPAVGFIGGKSGELIGAFQAGFEQGVWAVEPDMTIFVSYIEDFYDSKAAQDLAFEQYENGAGVIFAAAGEAGKGVLEEALIRGDRFMIGVDHDQYEEGLMEEGNSVILTSLIKRVDEVSYTAAVSVLEGTFEAGIWEVGLSEGMISLELTAGRNLSEETITILKEAEQAIIDGTILVEETPVLPVTNFTTIINPNS